MWRAVFVLMLLAAGDRMWAQTSIWSFSVTPATLSFTSTDPDVGVTPQSSTARAYTRQGSNARTWQLLVSATSATVTSCGQVPISAFKVACTTVTVGGGGGGTCSGQVPVSTTPQVVASGAEGTGIYTSHSVSITVSIADSWRYPAAQAAACTLTLQYTMNMP